MALPMPSLFTALNSSSTADSHLIPTRRLVVVRRVSNVGDGSISSEQPVPPKTSSSSAEAYPNSNATKKLDIGTPIIVIEAPQWIKTATAISSLRVNAGFINAGDVGRVMSRKPKDVWAVRFRIGTYLIDGKYFKALELDETAS